MLEFSKDFPMKFGMFFLISKSQDVKILGIKRTGFPILSQQKMKEHDDMLKRYKSLSSKYRIHCHFLKMGFFSKFLLSACLLFLYTFVIYVYMYKRTYYTDIMCLFPSIRILELYILPVKPI